MQFSIGFIAGLFIGIIVLYFLLRTIIFNKLSMGDLCVKASDITDMPYLLLELGADVNAVINRKYVIFRVKLKDIVPHE